MAAIDKLYVKNYWTYENLLKWSFAYFPKLIPFLISTNMQEYDFERCKRQYVKDTGCVYERELNRIGGRWTAFGTACVLLQEYYKKVFGEVPPTAQIEDEVEQIQAHGELTDEQIAEQFSMAVMNTPAWIDRRLKWLCPLPEVREYLHKQCGVSPKFEWLYRLFWRGKRIFLK